MRLYARTKWLFAVAGIALATGPAGAQAPAGGGGSTAPNAQVQFQGNSNLSAEEMEKQADGIILSMEGAASRIGKRQLKAAADADVVLANCLKDKLSQIDTAIRSAKDRRNGLRNPDLRSHAFTIIVVQKGNADRTVREAAQCIGKDATTAGETRVTTTIDQNLPPDDDKFQFPVVDPPVFVPVPPPPAASPVR
jgi:hypothetical protein